VKAWLKYAGTGLAVAAAGVIGAVLVGPGPVAKAVAFSAVLAWTLQVVAFAILLKMRDGPTRFMVAWLGGIALRFLAVGVVAYWVTRTEALPPSVTLVSLVAYVFVMLLLEPLFMRKGQSTP